MAKQKTMGYQCPHCESKKPPTGFLTLWCPDCAVEIKAINGAKPDVKLNTGDHWRDLRSALRYRLSSKKVGSARAWSLTGLHDGKFHEVQPGITHVDKETMRAYLKKHFEKMDD